MTRPPVLEITVKVGLLTDEGIIQYQVTALDAADERVIAMWSLPGRDAQNWQQDLSRALLELEQLLKDNIDPF